MTAEIAVMNKSAVALAADSAVTIGDGRSQKIYNTVSKLFALIPGRPVGIMIYGNAELMEVPWETIIRIYQQKTGGVEFSTLQDYANHFFSFLDRKNDLFSKRQQADHFTYATLSAFKEIRDEIADSVEKYIASKGEATEKDIEEISAKQVDTHFSAWSKAKKLKHLPTTFRDTLLKKYRSIVNQLIEVVFEKLPLTSKSRKQLVAISAECFYKDIFPSSSSGIVIAGFGRDDVFPSLEAYEACSVINNRLKYRRSAKSMKVDCDMTASVIPFAQDDVVITFVEGCDPDFRVLTLEHLRQILNFYPIAIVKNLASLSQRQKDKLVKELKGFGVKMEKEIFESLHEWRSQNHVNPLLSVIEVLPKEELAAMAESLVNLTCQKRKMSLNAETVGGPIDVAVISKGEGLIWIKRKHYFKSALNPQFFSKKTTLNYED